VKSHDWASLGTDHNLGLTLAALGAVLFSTKAVLVKLAYPYPLTPEALLSLRMLFAMPVYLAVAAYLGRNGARLSARDLLGIAAFGLVGYYAASLLDFAALVRISVGLERLALSTYSLIVVLLSALAFGRPITGECLMAGRDPCRLPARECGDALETYPRNSGQGGPLTKIATG
jgi:drug/metabolite transporter (DMT)-like permease